MWNASFDPALVDYDTKYDNALDFSPTFRLFTKELVASLVETFDLRRRTIAEIGSGKGEFLRALCAAGANRGVGYDPTYEGPSRDGKVEFVRELFGSETVPDHVDFLACRHVLEHVDDPVGFLVDVRRALGDRAVPVYIEVPNGEFNFRESGPWDLIYPHVGYFNERSLRTALTRAGFRVLRSGPIFDAQFLGAQAVPGSGMAASAQVRSRPITSAAQHYRNSLTRQLTEAAVWQKRLREFSDAGSVTLWGAGSKGVSFLSLVDVERVIESVIDINPRKWGRFLPGVGHEVMSPGQVLRWGTTTVLVSNPAYLEEIRGLIRQQDSRAEPVLV